MRILKKYNLSNYKLINKTHKGKKMNFKNTIVSIFAISLSASVIAAEGKVEGEPLVDQYVTKLTSDEGRDIFMQGDSINKSTVALDKTTSVYVDTRISINSGLAKLTQSEVSEKISLKIIPYTTLGDRHGIEYRFNSMIPSNAVEVGDYKLYEISPVKIEYFDEIIIKKGEEVCKDLLHPVVNYKMCIKRT